MQQLSESPSMWLYESVTEVDLKVNKALHKAKKAIMEPSTGHLKEKVNINAAGQEAIGADVLSETVFLNTLVDENLNGTLYSEESGVKRFGAPSIDDPHSLILILDPLDGSQNYLKGIPFGCISVAYGPYNPDPILSDLTSAAIMNLYTNEEFFAEKGYGSYKNGLKLQTFNELDLTSYHERPIQISYYAYGSRASKYAYDFQRNYSLRSLGSAAWELALVSETRNDAFADIRGVLKTHDFAAARLILEELDADIRFPHLSDDEVSNIPLDEFTTGYSMLASLDSEFLDFLEDEFYQHGLITPKVI